MEVFGVSKEVQTGELVKELNDHVETLIMWISNNEQILRVTLNDMYAKLKVEKDRIFSKGGRKSRKKKKKKTKKYFMKKYV